MMNTKLSLLVAFLLLQTFLCWSQNDRSVMDIFPTGTTVHENIPYNNDTLKKHLLDIYVPAEAKGKLPLVIWVHGGGWLVNDKYADMSYMKSTIREIINSGFALASIDYRFSTQATFPAQIQDCNQAIAYLYKHAEQYGFDQDRFAVMGFSAGGHLASMIGVSKNNNLDDFFMPEADRSFSIKAVVDFYGPAELVLFPGADDPKSPEGLLIGAAPVARPDLAKVASPTTYVDEKDPPFLIIHGEKDDMVDPRHSRLMSGWLNAVDVSNELIIVKDAPHFGDMFDVEWVRSKVLTFLKEHLENE